MPDNILIIKPSSLGDVVHALPVLAKLRGAYPGASISWLVGTAAGPLVESNPHLDAVYYFRRRKGGPWGTLKANVGLAQKLKAQDFDCVVDLQGLLRSAFFAWASRAPRRIGLSDAREGASLLYTDVVKLPGKMHAVDRYLAVGAALGFDADGPEFLLRAPDSAHRSVERLLEGANGPLPRPYIVLSPGARWTSKCWPAANFAEAARISTERFGGTVFLVGAANVAARAAAEIEAALDGRALNLVGRTSLDELIALLGMADFFITPDTGLMHIADALGTPLVAVFGPTDPELTGPYFQRNHVVTAPDACDRKPCLRRNCDNPVCMSDVSGREVADLAATVLEGAHPTK